MTQNHDDVVKSRYIDKIAVFTAIHSCFLSPWNDVVMLMSLSWWHTDGFNKSSTVVIPQSVNVSRSLLVSGTTDDWTVHWAPVTVHSRSVYYHVTLQWGKLSRLHRVSQLLPVWLYVALSLSYLLK